MTFKITAAAALVALGSFAYVAPVAMADMASATLKAVDTDNDGSITLVEAKAAAAKTFAALDTDHEGTIDSKEAGMNVTALDKDNDGTLDKSEYMAAVTDAFKAADPDNDGTVDTKELASPAGKTLDMMISPKS
jgi:Ca2+-binding EF-hand superfamily protein